MFDVASQLTTSEFLFRGVTLHIEADGPNGPCRFDAAIAKVDNHCFTIIVPPKFMAWFGVQKDVSVVSVTEGGLFVFTTTVLRLVFGALPIVALALPESFEQLQRRESVRIREHLTATLEFPGINIAIEVLIRNLSAGGCVIQTGNDLRTRPRAGTPARILFRLDDQQPDSDFDAQVKWCLAKKEGRFRIGLQFLHVTQLDRDRINAYLLAKQLSLRTAKQTA
jgi:c-di-GMP-binding flagellar brake protein YcgR